MWYIPVILEVASVLATLLGPSVGLAPLDRCKQRSTPIILGITYLSIDYRFLNIS